MGDTLNKFIKFCTVGGTGVIVNMGILFFLTEVFGLYYLVSSIFGIEISILTNFVLNDLWTYKNVGNNNISSILKRALSFNLICIMGLIINFGVLVTLTEKFGIYYLISNMVGILCATVWNFFMTKNITWKVENMKC